MQEFRYLCLLVCLSVCFLAGVAHADAAEELAGSIEAELNGEKVLLSSLRNDYRITVVGDIANVKLIQTFENPYQEPLNARYLFPLNRRAAVHAMTLRVGNEVIRAQIQEIREAKKTFEKAKRSGKAAALLQQHRPNMFTQKVANLMPGLPITVEIEYVQTVPKVDGAYELVVPMVVGPRFQPAGAGVAPDDGATPHDGVARKTGQWMLEQLPAYPPAAGAPTAGVHIPAQIASERVSLQLELEAPVPLVRVYSDTHALRVRDISSTQLEIGLQNGRVLDNKDFVLRFVLGGAVADAGLLSHWEPLEGGYFSLLIEPPTAVSDAGTLPREMVFLLDCSGSMAGKPMEASKRFMTNALSKLRPNDRFRIIRFSDKATEFSARALPATPANIERGLQYTKRLHGGGGTVMTSGIRQALQSTVPDGTVRNVVFLTDGYIGNEVSVLQLVNELLGDARLYAFGVGAGVNRYLLDELGRVGRGFTRYFDPTREEEALEVIAAELAAKLQTPVLTDLDIDWGGLGVTDVVPKRLPDLYAGDSIRVTGRYHEPASGALRISGQTPTRRATVRQTVVLPNTSTRPSVRRIWARTAVAERMHEFITPAPLRADEVTNEQLQAAVTDLGLLYGLATQWTAFVAVSQVQYNTNPISNKEANVALPKVAGVSELAYMAPAMTGHGTPEPGTWLSLLVGMLTFAWWRRRQSRVVG